MPGGLGMAAGRAALRHEQWRAWHGDTGMTRSLAPLLELVWIGLV